LALTFGTLLSSQGADAQKIDPLGLRFWLEVLLYAASGCSPRGGLVRRALAGSLRRMENHTRLRRGRAGGSSEVSPAPG
jgi:hypothetical protein